MLNACTVVILWLFFRGINFVLSALVFNIVPTVFEVGLVTGILVRSETLAILHFRIILYILMIISATSVLIAF